MSYFAYIIGSINDEKFITYVGWTNNIDKRLKKHNSNKGAKSTKGRIWELLYFEELKSKSEALKREYALKKDRKFRKSYKITIYKILTVTTSICFS